MDYAERSSCIEGRRISIINGWVFGERPRMQKSKGISERIRPHVLIRIIEDSKIPLEEESKLQKIKEKWNMTNNSLERMKSSSPDWSRGLTNGRRD